MSSTEIDGGVASTYPLDLADAVTDLAERESSCCAAAREAKRPTVRSCLDWTERRHHLAGSAATGLLDALIAKKWVARTNTPRAIRVTEAGRIAIFSHFDLGDARLAG